MITSIETNSQATQDLPQEEMLRSVCLLLSARTTTIQSKMYIFSQPGVADGERKGPSVRKRDLAALALKVWAVYSRKMTELDHALSGIT